MSSSLRSFYDAWLSYSEQPREDTFVCEDGEIRFFFAACKPYTECYIHCVCVREEKQRKGYFTAFIDSLLQDERVGIIGVLGVTSMEMFHCMNKMGSRFEDHGGDFMWKRK